MSSVHRVSLTGKAARIHNHCLFRNTPPLGMSGAQRVNLCYHGCIHMRDNCHELVLAVLA
jgi:hypothetical protein